MMGARTPASAGQARPKSLWGQRLWLEVLKPFSPLARARSREPLFLYMLREALGDGGTLLEIGSSDGCEAIEALTRTRAHRVVIAEPDPANIEAVRAALQRERVEESRVQIVNCAIGAATGTGAFHFHPTRSHLNSAMANGEGARTRTIEFRSLPDFMAGQQISTPTLVKMDIEGHEVEVLRGAMDLLHEAGGISILMEVHPSTYTSERSMAAILRSLFDHGYTAALVEAAGTPRPPEYTDAGLVPFLVSGTRGLYRDVPPALAVEFCSRLHGNTGRKLARSILLKRAA